MKHVTVGVLGGVLVAAVVTAVVVRRQRRVTALPVNSDDHGNREKHLEE